MKVKKFKTANVNLFDTQIDLILNSLEYYLDNKINPKYNNRKVCLSKEEYLEKTTLRYTYYKLFEIKNQMIAISKSDGMELPCRRFLLRYYLNQYYIQL